MSLIKHYKFSLPHRYHLVVDAGLDGAVLRASISLQSMLYGYFAPGEDNPHVWDFGVQDDGAYPDGVPTGVVDHAGKLLLELLGDGHLIKIPTLQHADY